MVMPIVLYYGTSMINGKKNITLQYYFNNMTMASSLLVST